MRNTVIIAKLNNLLAQSIKIPHVKQWPSKVSSHTRNILAYPRSASNYDCTLSLTALERQIFDAFLCYSFFFNPLRLMEGWYLKTRHNNIIYTYNRRSDEAGNRRREIREIGIKEALVYRINPNRFEKINLLPSSKCDKGGRKDFCC